jgi:hypothetical protein
MISLTSTEHPIQLKHEPYEGTCYMVKWIENWESIKGTTVLIDGKEFFVKNVQRNRCLGFFSGSEEEWETRDVGVLV